MEIIKTKIKNEWINGIFTDKPEEKIEAIIFEDANSNKIVSIEDMSFLTDISVQSLKNYITSKHVSHYYIGQRWFVNIEEFFSAGKRTLK